MEALAPVSEQRPFLSADWRWLAMLNWRVEPALLEPLLPRGTELDSWNGMHFVSVVGFRFLRTKLLGIPIPMHRNFTEVNLRFYTRRRVGGEIRQGVTFVREMVARPAITLVAKLAYNEPYRTVPMRHRIVGTLSGPRRVEYSWRTGDRWSRLGLAVAGEASPLRPGSEEEFITLRHWGYTAQRDGGTIEYRVDHQPWNIYPVVEPSLEGDLLATYGGAFARLLEGRPWSALLADGSAVTVMRPTRL